MTTATDLFGGAGGTTEGAVEAGVEVQLAINHNALAVESHNANHPNTKHALTDLLEENPSRYFRTDLLFASPECRFHTNASGKPRSSQLHDLFGSEPDPFEVRSRATMEVVIKWAERWRYRGIIVENVVEVRDWIHFDRWYREILNLGYEGQIVYLNSQFVHPTPQSRDRIYIAFHRRGSKPPDLNIRPLAPCRYCGRDVESIQSWRNPRRQRGKWNESYDYRCPTCTQVVRPYYYPALSVIDWSIPAPRIGDREELGLRPIEQKTRDRIQIGLDRFAYEPMGVETVYKGADASRTWPLSSPGRAQTTRQSHALVVPPFVASYYGTTALAGIDAPLPTQPTHDRHGLVVPPFVLGYYTRLNGIGAAVSGVDEPMPAQSTQPRHYLTIPPSMLMGHYTPGWTKPTTAPFGSITTQDHHSLVEVPGIPTVDECGFRMFQPHEIKLAMGFPNDYIVLGSKRDQVKQLGNANPPPNAKLIAQRFLESFQ